MTPTARTLAHCRKQGWLAQVVEQTIPRSFIKRDLFGVIDILAVTPLGLLGIQATSSSNHAARITKALAEPRLRAWLETGARFEVWSFGKQGARGKRKTWTLRVEAITLEQMQERRAA